MIETLHRSIGPPQRATHWRQAGRAAGFTVIELMVVLAVLAILASLTLPVAELTVKRAKERELKSALVEMRAALDAYKRAVDEGRIQIRSGASGYPSSLAVLVEGVTDEKDSARRTLYFLRRIPRDPFALPALTPEEQWGLRSYASPADDPRPGADVYDVYSLSDGVGLNGIPYRAW